MYLVNRTFDQSRVEKTYNAGSKYSFSELVKNEIEYLVANNFISPIEVKGSSRSSKRTKFKDELEEKDE